uniref:Selenoprotein T n=1 Tax=Leptobrachium leishanense TaxID=445787 RepID=A0A8C5M8U1_9ANUR
MRVISQRYPDIRIEGENYLPQPIYRHLASFLSVFKLVLIGLIVLGKDPFAFIGMEAPSLWQWGQENKVYACMMVFFLSNMIENQCMSTGAFEVTLNGKCSAALHSVSHCLIFTCRPSLLCMSFSLVRFVGELDGCAESVLAGYCKAAPWCKFWGPIYIFFFFFLRPGESERSGPLTAACSLLSSDRRGGGTTVCNIDKGVYSGTSHNTLKRGVLLHACISLTEDQLMVL